MGYAAGFEKALRVLCIQGRGSLAGPLKRSSGGGRVGIDEERVCFFVAAKKFFSLFFSLFFSPSRQRESAACCKGARGKVFSLLLLPLLPVEICRPCAQERAKTEEQKEQEQEQR